MKQITYYNTQFGIEGELPLQEDFSREIREKELLARLDLIISNLAEQDGIEIGDVCENLGVAVLQCSKRQKVYVQADGRYKAINHVKQAGRIIRNAFNTMIEEIKNNK